MKKHRVLRNIMMLAVFIFTLIVYFYTILNILGLAKQVTDHYKKLPDYLRIIIAVILGLIFLAYAIYFFRKLKEEVIDDQNDPPVILEVDSKEYFDFFSEWYSRQGSIYIYCNDVEWMTDDKLINTLSNKILNKNESIYIYIVNEGVVSKKLQNAGAIVNIINSGTYGTDLFSFSCRNLNSTESLMLRYGYEDESKNNENGKDIIKVHQITDKLDKEMLKKIKISIESHSKKINLKE